MHHRPYLLMKRIASGLFALSTCALVACGDDTLPFYLYQDATNLDATQGDVIDFDTDGDVTDQDTVNSDADTPDVVTPSDADAPDTITRDTVSPDADTPDVTQTCTPNAVSCDENAVVVCNDAGTSQTVALRCTAPEVCAVIAGTGTCVPPACEPFSRGCFDAQTAFECAADGSARIAEPCSAAERCDADAGECVPLSVCLEFEDDQIVFAPTLPGNTATTTIGLRNCGEGPLVLRSIGLDGDSAFNVVPDGSFPSTLEAGASRPVLVRFGPASVGSYGADLTATADGISAVVPVSGSGMSSDGVNSLAIQLTWNTDEDHDLHLIYGDHAYGNAQWDCHYNNLNPDWGTPGDLHNPTLDRDDTDGFGPETIHIDEAERNATYRVVIGNPEGAHGSATVRVFYGGENVTAFAVPLDDVIAPIEVGSVVLQDGEIAFISGP